MTNNTTFVIIIGIVLFLASAMILHKTNPKCRYLSNSILCTLLFSVISTVSLGVNYIAAFTGKQDGIGLTGWLPKLIIGEGRWSVELFFSYFEAFITLSMMLIFIYFITLLHENKKKYEA